MRTLFSITIILCLFTGKVFADELWEYDPSTTTAHLEETRIWFSTGDTTKVGPELYANDTNNEFFELISNTVKYARDDNKKIIIPYKNYSSQNNGTYDCIIPES